MCLGPTFEASEYIDLSERLTPNRDKASSSGEIDRFHGVYDQFKFPYRLGPAKNLDDDREWEELDEAMREFEQMSLDLARKKSRRAS